ncbi:MAG: hypothetical protein DHS20C15_13660 [Planctomycetota bacterium]|nr:MAG: hypothetical protein DHS20C15_13660 [Planctomycetota bacterium]
MDDAGLLHAASDPISTDSTHATPRRRSVRSDPFLLACAAMPVVGLAVFSSFVLRARLALGEWPRPYRPDPNDLGFTLHHELAGVFLFVGLVSPVALAACLLLRRRDGLRVRHRGSALAVFVGGYALLWVLAWADPGHFLEWYAD